MFMYPCRSTPRAPPLRRGGALQFGLCSDFVSLALSEADISRVA